MHEPRLRIAKCVVPSRRIVFTGTGSEVMSRIAAPMVGGMIASTVLTLGVIPSLYALVKQWQLRRERPQAPLVTSVPALSTGATD